MIKLCGTKLLYLMETLFNLLKKGKREELQNLSVNRSNGQVGNTTEKPCDYNQRL